MPDAAQTAKKRLRYDAQRAVWKDPRLKAESVRLYFALDDHAGPKGQCRVTHIRLAREGLVPPQVARLDAERIIRKRLSPLVKLGYVKPKRTGRGNEYTLGWVVEATERNERPYQRSEPLVLSDRTERSCAYKEEPYFRTVGYQQSSSSRVRVKADSPKEKGDDDDSLSEETKTPKTQNPNPADSVATKVCEILLSWVKRNGWQMPSDPVPHEEIAQNLKQTRHTIGELNDFLKELAERLKNQGDHPSTWRYVSKSVRNEFATPNPANSIAVLDRVKEQWVARAKANRGQNAQRSR